MHEYYIEQAIIEAKKAFKKGDVPVGCVIVKDNKIISKAYNKKENNKNSIKHAEIIAISRACKKLKTWHLEDCVLYTTMEPCMMCSGAILQSRIKTIVYSVENKKYGDLNILKNYNKKINLIKNIKTKEVKILLNDFFKDKRN